MSLTAEELALNSADFDSNAKDPDASSGGRRTR